MSGVGLEPGGEDSGGTPTEEARLRSAIEATRLNFGLTGAEVRELVGRSRALGARGICVPPCYVPTAVACLGEGVGGFDVVTVANFPTGDHAVDAVERVAVGAVRNGANHVDLVVPGGLVADRDWSGVIAYIRQVHTGILAEAPRRVSLKIILETAAWDPERLLGAAEAALDAGADWLKTSTGFHPAGGATLEAVAHLRSLAPVGVGIKASGGIRTRSAALAMLDAGADRIGTSAEAVILG